MSEFLRVMTLEEARVRLERHWRPKPRVTQVPVLRSRGLVLAEDVRSRLDLPPFDRAAFDGYAVRAMDTFGAEEDVPIKLRLVGKARAGAWPRKGVRAGECMEIATGAPVPRGANAVVMVEHASARGKWVEVRRAVSPWENVSKRGSELRRGEIVVKAGVVLTPSRVGALAAAGVKRVRVFRRPKVAVISTGTEVKPLGGRLGKGKIYDANGPALCGAIEHCGAEARYLGIFPDREDAIAKAVELGLGASDLVVISGGASAGARDLVPQAVQGLGRPGVVVHGLALKPGKPTFLAVVRGKPVFGLPGYPVSALVVFYKLVAPYLRKMLGLPTLEAKVVKARLSSKVWSARGREELVPVKLELMEELVAKPILKGPGAITSLSGADGYFEVPAQKELIEEGELVEVRLMGEWVA